MEQLRVFWFVKHRTKKVHAHVIVASKRRVLYCCMSDTVGHARMHQRTTKDAGRTAG